MARKCSCTAPHLPLQGNAPDGRSWTAVASPYWPAFAEAWAKALVGVKPMGDFIPAPSHLAGFAMAPSSLSMEQVLNEMSFVQPRQREIVLTAIHVSSGIQVSGRALPTLLPEGLGPTAHLEIALQVTHPLARPVTAPGLCQLALDAQVDDPDVMNARRASVISAIRELAAACLDANGKLTSALHPSVRTTAALKNIVFMKELDFASGHGDPLIWCDYCFGLPMLGYARHSTTMVQRPSRPPGFPLSNDELAKANDVVLHKVKPSRDPKVDLMAWEKTTAEFAKGSLLGPFYDLRDLPHGRVRLLPRFAILERHGNAIADS